MASKLGSWTLDEKLKMIKDYEKSGLSKTAFAKTKGIPRTTFVTMLSSKQRLENSLRVQDGVKRKKMRKSNYEDVEEAVLKWFTYARSQNVPISGVLLKEKAIEISREMGVLEFSASNGWIERFKARNKLSFKKMCGEAAAVSHSQVSDWKVSTLKDVLERYTSDDVFNLDETGLFFRLLPEKTLCFQSDTCSGGKKSKERVTVLLGANMSGSEKLKPLVIGKSKKPRCFRNVKSLPVHYESNRKSWMSSEIWENTLKSMDRKFHSMNRKVAFIVDNCSAHVEVPGLNSIELIYMPPNATAILQPLDQGIILNFKRNYRKLLVKDWIKAIDEGRDFKPSLPDALKYVHKSWADVSSKTIHNCFKHAGFTENNPSSSDPECIEGNEEEDIPLAILFKELLDRKIDITGDVQMYIDVDKDVTTSPDATISEIVKEIKEKKTEISSDPESESDMELEQNKPPTKTQALHCIETIRNYLTSISETTDIDYNSLYNIEKRIVGSTSTSRDKQTLIHQYFM